MAHDPRVYVQFDGVNWTDITQYVVEYEITRGRSYELDDFEAATLKIILDNEDGRFTPRKTSSPYYPNVKPRRNIKVVNVGPLDDPTEFFGSVERWPVTAGQGVATVTVDATDPLAPVAQIEAKRPVAELIIASNPRRYYPLSDGLNSAIAGDWGSDGSPASIVHSKYGGDGNIGGTGLLTRGEGTNGGSFRDPNGFSTAGTSIKLTDFNETLSDRLSVYFLVKIPTSISPSRTLWVEYSPDGRVIRHLSLTSTGNFVMYHANSVLGHVAGTEAVVAGGVADKVYLIHMWTGDSLSNAFGFSVYDSNGLVGSSSSAITSRDKSTVTAEAYIGPKPNVIWETPYASTTDYWYPKEVSNLVVDWGKPETGASNTLTSWLTPALASSPLTDTDYFGVLIRALTKSTTYTVLGTGVDTQIYYPNWNDGVNGRDLIRQFEDTTGGAVYMPTHLDHLAYYTRHYRVGQPSEMTFSATGAAIDGNLLFEVDEARIVNDTTVIRTAGGEFRSVDATSIEDYGRHSNSVTIDVVDEREAQAAAEWHTYVGSDPLVRCDQVTVNAAAQPTYSDDIARLDIGAKITLSDLPAAAPYTSAEFFIEGITKRVVVDGETPEHDITFQLSPAEKLNGWILGDSQFGLLGTTTIALY